MSNYSERGKILHKCHICCKQFKQYDLELHFLSCNVEDDEDIKDEIQDELQDEIKDEIKNDLDDNCLLYTSPSPRDLSTSRMPSSA